MDSLFIQNKHGTEKIGRNKFYKNKKDIKLTTIVDAKEVPINIKLSKDNKHDVQIALKILNMIENNSNNINTNTNIDNSFLIIKNIY